MRSEAEIRIAQRRCRRARRIWLKVERMKRRRRERECRYTRHGRQNAEYERNFLHCARMMWAKEHTMEREMYRVCPGYGKDGIGGCNFPCAADDDDRGCHFLRWTAWLLAKKEAKR